MNYARQATIIATIATFGLSAGAASAQSMYNSNQNILPLSPEPMTIIGAIIGSDCEEFLVCREITTPSDYMQYEEYLDQITPSPGGAPTWNFEESPQ